MKAVNKSKIAVKKAISNVAIKAAVNSTNATCLWFQYQPKQPVVLKNLKK